MSLQYSNIPLKWCDRLGNHVLYVQPTYVPLSLSSYDIPSFFDIVVFHFIVLCCVQFYCVLFYFILCYLLNCIRYSLNCIERTIKNSTGTVMCGFFLTFYRFCYHFIYCSVGKILSNKCVLNSF